MQQTYKPFFQSAQQAQTFNRRAYDKAATIAQILVDRGVCSGDCKPYEDIFTFARWQAQGYRVKPGSHGVKNQVNIPAKKVDEQGNTIEYWTVHTTTLFCRCQTEKR